jgi:hypothetical protein
MNRMLDIFRLDSCGLLWLESGLSAQRFPVDWAVSLIVPFEEAPDALRSWTENPSKFKKILVSLD